MPRTQTDTIAIIVTMSLLAFLTAINIWQTNSAESDIRDVKGQMKTLSETNQEILRKLENGVAMKGNASGGNTTSSGSGAAKYAESFKDPKNLLIQNTSVKVPEGAIDGGTLKRVATSDFKGFNWVTESSVDVANLQAHVHSTFAARDFNAPDSWASDLAHKITVSDDFTEYTIHLRDDVYWHVPKVDYSKEKYSWLKKPRKLTADDCIFYFELMKNAQVEIGSLKSYYEDLVGAEKIDDYTFKVKWKKKIYHSKSFTIGVYPMPKWLFTKTEDGKDIPTSTLGLKFNDHWASKLALGVGPYKLEQSKAGEKTILARNDRYYGDKFPIDRIEYAVVKDPETMYTKFKAGELDMIPKVPNPRVKPDIFDGKEKKFANKELEYQFSDVFAYYYFGWNQDTHFFKDKRVRLAMTHTLNRELILKNVLNGLGAVQTGPYYYKHPATDSTIKPIPYDLEKAKALLAEAGWADTDSDGILDKTIDGTKVKFEIVMVAYDKPETKTVLSIWKEDLRKIGVVLKAQHVDWPTMQKKMDEKKFDAFTGGWGLSWEINPNQIWHSSQADIPKGSNRVGFRNKEADKVIEDLLVEFDEAKRIVLAKRFHQIVHEEQPYTFFYSPQYVTPWTPRLENVIINKIRPQRLSLPWYIDDAQKKAKVQGK